MTLISPETLTQPTTREHNLIVGDFASLPTELQEQWATLRRDFMDREMNWHVETDYDAYDADPATLQLLLQDGNGDITAGMRLTPRASIQETLSWSMIPYLPDGAAADVAGPVWDLTRLVPGSAKGRRERMAAFAELFGAGLANNLAGEADPQWVFATYPAFASAFSKYGIEFTPIVGTERNGAQLHHAHPVERTQFLVDNKERFPDAYESVQRGIARVSGGRYTV